MRHPHYHDIETPAEAKKDHYLTRGFEDEEETYEAIPSHHTFNDDEMMFGSNDRSTDDIDWGFKKEFESEFNHFNNADDESNRLGEDETNTAESEEA